MNLTFKPIKVWPPGWAKDRQPRKESPFSATYSSTLKLLDRELTHLGAAEGILQLAVDEREIRMDGSLRANVRVDYPGVILSFASRKHGQLSYPCNAFSAGWTRGAQRRRPGWHDNLRAIALGLDALRQVERYGIAQRGEQYAGFAELGTGIALGRRAAMTVEEAAKILHEGATPDSYEVPWTAIPGDPTMIELAYRTAAKRLHPDAGGDPEVFAKLTEAVELLRAQS